MTDVVKLRTAARRWNVGDRDGSLGDSSRKWNSSRKTGKMTSNGCARSPDWDSDIEEGRRGGCE